MSKSATTRAIGETPQPSSPLTVIAPPQDTHSTAPGRAARSEPREPPSATPEAAADEAVVGAAQAAKTIWDIQRIWYDLASRAWMRAAQLPVEAAGCRSVEALFELQRRHLAAGMNDLVSSGLEIAAIGTNLPRKAVKAGSGARSGKVGALPV